MSRNRKYQRSPEAMECRASRARELRDLNSKLRKKYRQNVVDEFFRLNYFIQPNTVEMIIRESDNKPVDLEKASLIYKTAMQDNFHL
jgi:hypothetical protein